MRTATIAMATAALAAAHVFAAATPTGTATGTTTAGKGVASPSTFPQLGSAKSQGCYSSVGNLNKLDPPLQFMAMGSCTQACAAINATVSGLHASDCYCGNEYPPKSDYTPDNTHCNYPCPFYDIEACGGIVGGDNNVDYYGIFNNGLQVDVPFLPSPTNSNGDSSNPGPSHSSPATATVTQTSKPSGGSNAGGIAAGVIVAVVAVAGIVGGVFYFLRRKRNREIEEEYRRNAAVNAFINGSKPTSSGGLSISDQRLDPVMAQRRMSSGSIADNQDYSRRILRVTNA